MQTSCGTREPYSLCSLQDVQLPILLYCLGRYICCSCFLCQQTRHWPSSIRSKWSWLWGGNNTNYLHGVESWKLEDGEMIKKSTVQSLIFSQLEHWNKTSSLRATNWAYASSLSRYLFLRTSKTSKARTLVGVTHVWTKWQIKTKLMGLLLWNWFTRRVLIPLL